MAMILQVSYAAMRNKQLCGIERTCSLRRWYKHFRIGCFAYSIWRWQLYAIVELGEIHSI